MIVKKIIMQGIMLGGMLLYARYSEAFGNKTLFVPRSQSVDAARELMGWQREINRYGVDHHYWSLSLAPEYMRAFRFEQLVDYLLAGHSTFTFSGSRSGIRGSRDLLADYFGLPSDFKSVVCFQPRITNFLFDINFYMGLDSIYPGLYFRIHAPIVHAKWNLHLKEEIQNQGKNFHPAGYMAADRVPRSDLSISVEFALQGLKAQVKIDETDPDFTDLTIDTTIREPLVFGDMHEPLSFGLVEGRKVMTRLSDVQVVLGCNFFQDTWYHAGLNIRAALPTGNRPCARFFFEPLVGNGGHWELGLGFTSHVDVWASADDRHAIAFYCDGNFTHLFKAQQRRSFEFKNNGPGNRYMLLEELVSPAGDLFVGGPHATYQYNQHLVPAINRTTFCVKVSVPIQADIVFKASYYHCGFALDLGYNFWARSKEHLVCRDRLERFYALKGDAQLYGFDGVDNAVALNATQHDATLNHGQGVTNFVNGREFANDNADSALLATNPGVLVQLNTTDSAALAIPQLPVNGSNPAQLLSDADIDNNSALSPRAITHKLFFNMSNRWDHCDGKVIPFLGIGFEVEIGPKHFCDSKHEKTGLSQWGILFKGGISY